MPQDPIRDLLCLLEVVRDACDLDLLVFLHRHPRAMVASEQLAAYIGCDQERTARSLENLIEAGLAARRRSPSSAVPMLLFTGDGRRRGEVASLLAMASTRSGRAQVLQALAAAPPPDHPDHGAGEPAAEGTHD